MSNEKRISFFLEDELINKLDSHLLNNKNKYRNRRQFFENAIQLLIEEDNDNLNKNNKLVDDVKKLKSLLELNLQFTYSIMDRQDLKIVDLYYGGTLSAIKGREAIDFYYRNKNMNKNKNNKNIKETNKKKKKTKKEKKKKKIKKKKINPRWRITDL